MDKQEIIEKLVVYKDKLQSDVSMAFYEKGRDYGYERVGAWFNKTSSFLAEHMPSEVNKLDRIGKDCMTVRCGQIESDYDYFRRVYFNRLDAFLESLTLDIQNDEYDFAPNTMEVEKVEAVDKPKAKSNKVFIVHGHDGETKYRTANFLRQHDLDPIILHLKASRNRTIIEKLEKYTEDVGYGIVLYTPDDLGQVKSKASNGELDNRARQNVIFEHGYLMGLIGRENVVAIVKGDIELPNDISGVVYIDDADWEKTLLIELRDAGYALDIANL